MKKHLTSDQAPAAKTAKLTKAAAKLVEDNGLDAAAVIAAIGTTGKNVSIDEVRQYIEDNTPPADDD